VLAFIQNVASKNDHTAIRTGLVRRREESIVTDAIVFFMESIFVANRVRVLPVSCREFRYADANERGYLSQPDMRDLRGSVTGYQVIAIAV
jgi:hypothetical protein